jgi:hypothetical protein
MNEVSSYLEYEGMSLSFLLLPERFTRHNVVMIHYNAINPVNSSVTSCKGMCRYCLVIFDIQTHSRTLMCLNVGAIRWDRFESLQFILHLRVK